MATQKLIVSLFKRGLGELFVLRASETTSVLGQILLSKGRLVIKDRGFLKGTTMAQLGPCWDIGVMGALCDFQGRGWDSLTFVGPDHCVFEEDLGATRYGMIKAARNQYNESLIDFCGSVYRGFQLMLDNHFLPVILLEEIKLKDGGIGLVVTNLRMAGMPFAVLGEVNDELRKIVDPHVCVDVHEEQMNDEDFAALFANYQRKNDG